MANIDGAKDLGGSGIYNREEIDNLILLREADTYTRTLIDQKLSQKADVTDVYTKQEVDIEIELAKQEVDATAAQLVSNTSTFLSTSIQNLQNIINAQFNNYYNRGDVDTLISDAITSASNNSSAQITSALNNYYTKTETDSVVNGIYGAIDSKTTESEVLTLLQTRITVEGTTLVINTN